MELPIDLLVLFICKYNNNHLVLHELFLIMVEETLLNTFHLVHKDHHKFQVGSDEFGIFLQAHIILVHILDQVYRLLLHLN